MTEKDALELLSALKADLSERDRLIRRRTRVVEDLQGIGDRIQELRKRLGKEGADVARLERTSLHSLFHTVLGDKAERLHKERQEHLAARLQHQAALSEKLALEKEALEIGERLQRLADIEGRHAELLGQVGSTGEAARGIAELSDRRSRVESGLCEIVEGIEAGRAVEKTLDALSSTLESVEAWGVWDLLGGGLITTAVKHKRLVTAYSQIVLVRTLLGRFRRELGDVEIAEVPRIQLGEFLTFADYFFDSIVADWIVQAKVLEAKKRVAKTRKQVASLLSDLNGKRSPLESELQAIQSEVAQRM